MSETRKISWWKRVLFSELLVGKNTSHKIAYIGILVALNIVVNAVASIPLGYVQFSLSIFTSALTGLLIGPLFGFTACFLGDTLGFFISVGSANGWTPWVGLSTGMFAVIFALCVNGIAIYEKDALIVKLIVASVLGFLVCTFAISTTAGYFLWNSKGVPYWDFAFSRLIIQIWNNLANYALLFAVIPLLNHIKPLKIRIR